MTLVQEVDVRTRSFDRYAEFMSEEEARSRYAQQVALTERLEGRVIWHINTTAVGGGVAEMIRPLVGYARGAGLDVRWAVISGGPEFFRITRRLHYALQGERGDGSPLGDKERGIYEETLRQNAVDLATRLRPRDLVNLHDPQTAGLAPHLARLGAKVIWRSHIGRDTRNDEVERGWTFLRPYLDEVRAFVFSRQSYVPEFCEPAKTYVIPPSIDAFSPKNLEIDEASTHTILVHVGVVEGPPPLAAPHGFTRSDGTPGRVESRAEVLRLGRAPAWETPLVVHISRWDSLKDPVGVMQGFAALGTGTGAGGAELVLAGPNVKAVPDDDVEAARVYQEVVEAWRTLPQAVRNRVHLVALPSEDVEENAVIVNALQRHAAVFVQKGLVEGFGLTVTEAMWKGRPVVASAVGGLQDQVEDGVSGLLLEDPTDLPAFADALRRLLEDPEYAERLGAAARERAIQLYLDAGSLFRQADMIQQLDD